MKLNSTKDFPFSMETGWKALHSPASLNVEMDIHTGVHLIARTLGNLFAKPMQEIIMRHIFHNFEALCSGKETKTMSQEELSSQAGHFFHGKE